MCSRLKSICSVLRESFLGWDAFFFFNTNQVTPTHMLQCGCQPVKVKLKDQGIWFLPGIYLNFANRCWLFNTLLFLGFWMLLFSLSESLSLTAWHE